MSNNNNLIVRTDDTELIIEYLYTADQHITFQIKIKSNGFSGESCFCISKNDLRIVIDSLSKMDNSLMGSCDIRDYDSDAFLLIDMVDLGHLSITGQIGGSHQDHYMRFRFMSDQTILKNFIQNFEYALQQNKDPNF